MRLWEIRTFSLFQNLRQLHSQNSWRRMSSDDKIFFCISILWPWFWQTTTQLQVIGQERMTSWKIPKNEEEITSLFEMSSSATIVIVCPLFTPTSGLKTQSAEVQWIIFWFFCISLQTQNADDQWTAFLGPFLYFTSEGDSNLTPLPSQRKDIDSLL